MEMSLQMIALGFLFLVLLLGGALGLMVWAIGKAMSNQAQILATLTASAESMDTAVLTIVNIGKTVQAIGDDVKALKLVIEGSGDLQQISNLADMIAGKQAQITQALQSLAAEATAVDEETPPQQLPDEPPGGGGNPGDPPPAE